MKWPPGRGNTTARDRKSTRLNSSHTEIYTLSLHDALPILISRNPDRFRNPTTIGKYICNHGHEVAAGAREYHCARSEEHTSELQSHRDLHSFPTRRSSDLDQSKPRSIPQPNYDRQIHLQPRA